MKQFKKTLLSVLILALLFFENTDAAVMETDEVPAPYPISAELYDRRGGGRGDSLVIVYNKSFRDTETGHMDILPNYIEVFWDEERTDIIGYGLGVKGVDGKYYLNSAPADNVAYWQPYMLNDSTIILTRDDYYDSFSGQRIKTAGEGKVVSWETFNDPVRGPQTIAFTANIIDKIPPMVISAKFKGDERDCGTLSSPCVDQVTITISEPVKLLNEEVNPEASKTAFAYILRSFGKVGSFEVYGNQNDQSSIMRWRNSGTVGPAATGDSIVYVIFRAYNSDGNTAYTPSARDSVRFLATGTKPLTHPFTDLNGNSPHPLEWGTLIEGRINFTTDPLNCILTVDTNDEDKVKNALAAVLDDPNSTIEFFTLDRPIELIPVPDGWSSEDVRTNYPGSVGVVFRPDIYGRVIEFELEQNSKGIAVKVNDSDISFHAKSYYHTNLGSLVVSRELTGTSNHPIYGSDYPNSLKCSDAIFNINGARSCKTGAYGGNIYSGVYLAWNLKDAEGHLVSTGTYVQTYEFWWEINVNVAGQTIKSGKLDPYSKIETFGVGSCDEVPIVAKAPSMLRTQEPAYYSLKGEPLGKQKPKRAGVYIVRQNGVNRVEAVR
jgi:hypothetical protein